MFLIRLSVNEHMNCFHFLFIIYNAARIFVYKFLCGHVFSLGICLTYRYYILSIY